MRFRITRLWHRSLVLLLLWAPPALSQHAMHTTESPPLDTMPPDDAVLGVAPQRLMLHFGPEVRLVKLALRNPENDIVNIGFRYDPLPGREFTQSLPPLTAADYYRVEWAAVDGTGKLVKGMFHFSFGAGARPPSYWLEQQEQMQHIMAPDYRLLQQGLQ